MKHITILLYIVYIFMLSSCKTKHEETRDVIDLQRAEQTLDSLYAHYSVGESPLLRENYPFDNQYSATYLATDKKTEDANLYAYLWPYSGTFSAVNALLMKTGDKKYKKLLDKKILSGLEEYFDTQRLPPAYASYVNDAPQSDRFYDDNVWLGIDFTDLYLLTKETRYLDKAMLIWDFVVSGTDDKLGGGIYWCEQKKNSKNTCSNAPGAVFAFKLFEATNDSLYFSKGKELYDWTKAHLQDANDYLYFDNIKIDGRIGEEKYAYNSGQMMLASVLLYKHTQKDIYLYEAQEIAKSCYRQFFFDYKAPGGKEFRALKRGDIWFTAVMFRGFAELYEIDNDKIFINAFRENMDYAWDYAHDDKGLFEKDLTGQEKDQTKWLLTQAAMVEMYARLAMYDE